MINRELPGKLNSSALVNKLCLGGIFLIMLFCNWYTIMIADDFWYSFSFLTQERITNVMQIFPSMKAHWLEMNGRVVSHFLVQLSLMLPRWMFKIANTGIFTALVWMMYSLARPEKHNNILLLSIFGCIWLFTPNFGEVILWQDGAINYLWGVLFGFMFIKAYINKWLYDKNITPPILLVFALLLGAYSETCSAGAVFTAVLFLLLARFQKKRKIPFQFYLAIIFACIGYLFMLLSPAEADSKYNTFNFLNLFRVFLKAMDLYRMIWPMLIVCVAMAIAAFCRQKDADKQILAFCLLLGSLASIFVLTFALYCPERTACMGSMLLVASCGVYVGLVFDSDLSQVLTFLCSICLICTFYWLCNGAYDLYTCYHEDAEVRGTIIANRELGEMDVVLMSTAHFKTKYNPGYDGLFYLDPDPNRFMMPYMAKYYGVDSIRLYDPNNPG